nr:hypothetical protein [Tanacetum cinerariifolium]
MELKKILIEKIEENKSIQRSDEQRNLYKALVEAYEANKAILDTYGDSTILKRRREDDDQEGPSAGSNRGSKRQKEGCEQASASSPSEKATKGAGRSTTGKPPSSDRAWNTTLPAAQGDTQSWISDLARQTDARSSFNELLDTPIDFSNFIMHRLNVDTLTPDLLAGGEQASASTPSEKATEGADGSTTGSQSRQMSASKSAFTEEPVQTTCQMEETPHLVFDTGADDQPIYPHNLLQPLPLIPDNRGRRVILFEHFINNDLEYLRGGASSRKYTTYLTKMKAADYGHIKWIEDLVPREMWIQQPIHYNKHALWRVSHWGRKRKQFYGDGTLNDVRNALDDRLKGIRMQYFSSTIWRKGDKDIAAAMIQAIEKLLKTRRIMRSVKSYQKKLNLTKPDTYKSKLKNKTAYTSHSDPQGIIYVDQFKRKRLMRTDELHKFSDGTLNDVRTALYVIAAGIRMDYLPMRRWSNLDKKRARVMLQDIDKQLY